jgi:hypothetical protein
MNGFVRTLAVLACGLVTTLVFGVINGALVRLAGLDVFTWGFWIVIPVGAVACGAIAASGYALGAWLTGATGHPGLFIRVLASAVTTWLVFHYLSYQLTLTSEGDPVSASIGFVDYLTTTIEHSRIVIGTGQQIESGELSRFGYLFAVIQFVGCVIGSFAPWAYLASLGRCADCEKYTRSMGKRIQLFRSHVEARPHLLAVQSTEQNSEAYAELVRRPFHSRQAGANAVRFHATLDRCTNCERWLVRDRVEYQSRGHWESLPGARHTWITEPAPGLVGAFRSRG